MPTKDGKPAEGHLTSAIAMDVDEDGDYDLVLGHDLRALFCLGANAPSGVAAFHFPCPALSSPAGRTFGPVFCRMRRVAVAALPLSPASRRRSRDTRLAVFRIPAATIRLASHTCCRA